MNYISVCSGIEAATVAWHSLGFTPVAFAEIDKFPSAVLAHHYPSVPNWGDMTKFKEWPDANIDVLVAGTPCQSFSVAGLRRGLADPRGNLMLTYLAILDRYRPTWMVWENVPGVLSSNKGRDFGSFLGALGELGYGWAYRSLDAQFFHLAQRRERVFVVGCLRGWERAAQVLFEPESLSGYPPPSRETGKGSSYDVAPCLAASGRGFERLGDSLGQDCLVAGISTGHGYWKYSDVAATVTGHGANGKGAMPDDTLVTHALKADGFDASEDGTGRGTPLVPAIAPCLTQNYGKQPDNSDTSAGPMLLPVAFSCKDHGAAMGHDGSHANAGGQLRRLTPTECARLQGFPDSYLDITYRGKPAADGPKYKALGNSMAVPVMRFIGERIRN